MTAPPPPSHDRPRFARWTEPSVAVRLIFFGGYLALGFLVISIYPVAKFDMYAPHVSSARRYRSRRRMRRGSSTRRCPPVSDSGAERPRRCHSI